jgi:hypothetical protein
MRRIETLQRLAWIHEQKIAVFLIDYRLTNYFANCCFYHEILSLLLII